MNPSPAPEKAAARTRSRLEAGPTRKGPEPDLRQASEARSGRLGRSRRRGECLGSSFLVAEACFGPAGTKAGRFGHETETRPRRPNRPTGAMWTVAVWPLPTSVARVPLFALAGCRGFTGES